MKCRRAYCPAAGQLCRVQPKKSPRGNGIGERRLIYIPLRSPRSPNHDSAPRGSIRVPPSPGFSPGRCPAGAGRCAAGAGGLAAVGPVPSAAVAGRGGGGGLIGLPILAEGETVFRSGAAPDKFSGLADRAALLLSVWK